MSNAIQTPAGRRLAVMPPPVLAGIVRYFHVERDSGGAALVPASPYPMVTFFAAGGSLVPSTDGTLTLFEQPMLCGPVTVPMPVLWRQGTTFISALIEPASFARLFGVSPAALRDLPVALADVTPAAPFAALQDTLHGTDDTSVWLGVLQAWLLQLLARRPPSVPPLALPPALLALPAADIARRCGLGVRQLERRFNDTYGQSLRDMRRMARYVQALARLMQAPPRRGLLTRIAMDCGYHDQAHMIRDFVHYTGRAPRAHLRDAGTDPLHRLYRYDPAQRWIVARP
ncbi:helix-turn-helix domain-containing protein [[Empedobacter] haloabium]|uniref:Helix-turn-helix domain-containing protein n=1 Tax=[Empedobacter] haloabium TaxID=592317 RepID=A0ABZ1UNQ5_9BURK